MSELRVDLISDAAGTGPIDSIRAFKAVIHYDMLSLVATRSSRNVSSFADDATGKSRLFFTNAFSDVYYTAAGTAQKNDATHDGNVIVQFGGNTTNLRTASVDRVVCIARSGTALDMDQIQYSAEGDLL